MGNLLYSEQCQGSAPAPQPAARLGDAPTEDRSACEQGPSFGVVWVSLGWLFPFSFP